MFGFIGFYGSNQTYLEDDVSTPLPLFFPTHASLARQNKGKGILYNSNISGPIWNKRIQNRGTGKTTGKEYECSSKTDERKNIGIR